MAGFAGLANRSIGVRAEGEGQAEEKHDEKQHRAGRAERILVLRGRRVQLGGERRDDQRGDREHHERRDHARRLGVEMQPSVLEATDENRDAQHEQRVCEDGADQRRLHDLQETGAQRERADENLGKVAERRLQHARRPRTEVFADLLRAARHVHREQRQRDRRGDELDDGAGGAELRNGRGDDCRGRNAKDDAIAT